LLEDPIYTVVPMQSSLSYCPIIGYELVNLDDSAYSDPNIMCDTATCLILKAT